MKENWQKIEAIFHAALELESDQRDAFLKRECGGDDALRNEVEELLDGFDSNADFLSDPAFDVGMRALENARERSLIGRTFGPYEIVEKIGEGGMGEVYRAVDSRLDRTVALKFLSDALENDGRARRQLAKEARAAAALDHPNICSVFGLEEFDGQHFIVMQFIAGRTLSEILKERRLESGEFRSLAKQIIEAVAFAHSHGIIHRDLKPGNIMVGDDGRAKILDFGLAKAIAPNPLLGGGGDTSQFSNNGTLIGTVAYMSPEQLRGEKLDFRSDIFSLGIVLHEMLTGENPFARPTQAETIAAILGTDSSTSEFPDLSMRYRGLIQRSLNSDKTERFGSGAELVAEFVDDYANRYRSSIRRFFPFAILTLILMIASAAGGWFLFSTSPPKRTAAILKFSADVGQEDQYLADGIRRRILENLSNLDSLGIKNELQSSRIESGSVSASKVGRDFGVDVVLTGRIYKDGTQVRLTTTAVRTFDGLTIETTDDAIDESSIAGVISNITSSLIARVSLKLSPEDENRMSRRKGIAPSAEIKYLRGRYFLNQRSNNDLAKAITELRDAVDDSPEFAEAWAALANAYVLVSLPGNDRPLQPKEAVGLARKAAQMALTIDPDLSESYHALGTIASNIDWNWPDAEFNYRRAIELQSDFVPARTGLVTLLLVNARYDDALAEAIAARTIDPISISTGLSLASCYYFRREFSEMDRVLSELPQSSNDSLRIRYIRSYQLFLTGREMEATKMIEEVYLNGTDANKRLFAAPLGYGYARTGQTQKAREILRFVDSQVTYIPAQERATIHLGLREYERAIEYLQKSCEENFNNFPGTINSPLFAEISTQPAFAELRRCAKLD